MLLGFYGKPLRFSSPDDGTEGGGATTNEASKTGGEPGSSTNDASKGGEPPASSEGDQKPKDGAGKTFTQDELNAIVERRLAEEKTKAERQSKKAADAAAEKALADNQQFKELAEQRGGRIAELEAENAGLREQLANKDADIWRANVAAKHHLPARLASRIQGATEAEMDADAKELAKELKPAAAPESDVGKGNTRPVERKNGETPKDESGKAQPAYRFVTENDVAW